MTCAYQSINQFKFVIGLITLIVSMSVETKLCTYCVRMYVNAYLFSMRQYMLVHFSTTHWCTTLMSPMLSVALPPFIWTPREMITGCHSPPPPPPV